jgi:GTPase SAR1 family protein
LSRTLKGARELESSAREEQPRRNAGSMKKAIVNDIGGELRAEYDLTQLKGGVRGKYYEEAIRGTSLVVIEPERPRVNGNRTRVDNELVQQAEALTNEHRKEILTSIPETELHQHLKELFLAIEPEYVVEVTHGPKELGKDLILVRIDNLTVDVIGIVVKCGDIKGKTLGEVDELVERIDSALLQKGNRKAREIESQIRQAFLHEAELADFFRTLPVTKVIVLIAGQISREARLRLEKEKYGSVEVHGLNWLVRNFTAHYPYVFFEGELTNFIQKKIQELETKHRVIRSNRILSDSFVEPVVRATGISVDFGEELRATISRKRLPFSKLKSILIGRKKIILVGDPGTGKSAALAKLTIDLLREVYLKAVRSGQQRETKVPILASARDLLTLDTVRDMLEHIFGETEIIGRVAARCLIVDGLDEVVSERRTSVIGRAEEFAKELDCSLLIASRKIDLLSITPSGFERYELLPFGTGQALQLIEKVQSNPAATQNIRDGLDKMRYQIPMVPLSLILLIEIVEDQKEVPASVTELYERYADSVLGRYDKEKGIEVLFEYLIKKRFLAELAYHEFSSKGLVEISRGNFDSFCKQYSEKYDLDELLAPFVHEIDRAGLLEVGFETVLFRHRSFLDYFSAFYIYDKRDEIERLNDFIVDIYFKDAWGETAFFYVGLKREVTERLLKSILKYDHDSMWINLQKVMVGRLLQAGWHSPGKIKYLGVEQALSFIPAVREALYRVAQQGRWPEPKIVVDAVLTAAAEYSFRSMFLAKQLEELFDNLVSQEGKIQLTPLIYLLWVVRPFMSHERFIEQVEKMIDLSARKDIEPEERLRAALLLMLMKAGDKSILKAINKRLRKLRDEFPKEFKLLLPPDPKQKPKFRPPVSRKK